MNSGQAKRIVLVSVFVAGSLASVHAIAVGEVVNGKQQTGLPDVRIGVGALLLAIFLLTLAEIQPTFAGSLGMLVLISSIFAVGPETYKALTQAVAVKNKSDATGLKGGGFSTGGGKGGGGGGDSAS